MVLGADLVIQRELFTYCHESPLALMLLDIEL